MPEPHALLDAPLVIELGSRVACGAAGGLAAQLGASVVCIEGREPASHGKWRNRPVALAGKQSIVLDRDAPGDRVLLEQLLARADVVFLSTDTDPADAALWSPARASHTIVCDITAFGHSGPLAGIPMPEALVGALAGTLETTGEPERAPTFFGTTLLEMSAAIFAVAAMLAALRVRRTRGVGQHIDVALYDVALTALVNFLPLHLTGGVPTRAGNRHALQAPWNVHRARDGWIVICGPSNAQWARMCGLMARPELVQDARFATPSARLVNRYAADALVAEWAARQSVRDAEEMLLGVGIPCGPIVPVDSLAAERNVAHRRSVRSIGSVRLPASPLRGDVAKGIDPIKIPQPDEDRASVMRLLATPVPSRHATDSSHTPPCTGLKIIEVGQYTVAPLAGRMLGALGADVIKVEPPAGDSIRKTPPLRADGAAYIFALSNTDKRGVVLDLTRPADRERLHELLTDADALVENLKPGSLAGFGISRELLRERHPRLVYCSITGFGTDSAYGTRPALDTVIQAMSGLMDLTRADGIPMKTGISLSDNVGGQFALVALLAGLEYRDRTGHAVHFDLSMQDTSLWLTHPEWQPSGAARRAPALIATRDGYVACDAADPEARAALARAGLDPEQSTRADVVGALAPLPAAPCLRLGEVFAHPHAAARALLVERPAAGEAPWLVFSPPFKLMTTPAAVRTVMSRLGYDYSITSPPSTIND